MTAKSAQTTAPSSPDLRDSGSIEQDADIVLFLYREDYYAGENDPGQETDRNSGECIVAKNRHGEAKTVPLHWQTGRVNLCALRRRRLSTMPP